MLIAIGPIIILITTLIDLGKQIAERVPKAKEDFDELEAFILTLNLEGRDPTPEEMIRFTSKALSANEGVQAALQRLRDAKAQMEGTSDTPITEESLTRPDGIPRFTPDGSR